MTLFQICWSSCAWPAATMDRHTMLLKVRIVCWKLWPSPCKHIDKKDRAKGGEYAMPKSDHPLPVLPTDPQTKESEDIVVVQGLELDPPPRVGG
eukprot:3969-Eustigmatos_ZCMA.PRE.1